MSTSQQQRRYWAKKRAEERSAKESASALEGYNTPPGQHRCQATDIDYGDPGPTSTSTCRECGRTWKYTKGGRLSPPTLSCTPITTKMPGK